MLIKIDGVVSNRKFMACIPPNFMEITLSRGFSSQFHGVIPTLSRVAGHSFPEDNRAMDLIGLIEGTKKELVQTLRHRSVTETS